MTPARVETARDSQGQASVLLCSMPFGLILTPSLALGLLHAALDDLAQHTRQLYFSLRLASSLGYEAYRIITDRWEVGDWVFSGALFPDHDLDAEGFVERVIRNPPAEYRPSFAALPARDAREHVEATVAAALEARRLVPEFLDDCMTEVERHRPRLLGFSCLFQQRLASLALARLVRQRLPDTFILFGGPECHELRGIEMLRQFPFVDAVVSGPGDIVFPAIARRVVRDEPVAGLEGVYTQGDVKPASGSLPGAPPPADLDELPYPLFDDYFAELDALRLELPIEPYISLETSRGCWWGEQPARHCVFCGLNGRSLSYQAKSPRRMVDEVGSFARAHPGRALIMTDSILGSDYFDDALPQLAAKGLDLAIQYETRPTLTRDQLTTLREAGVTQIQPGIESLSTAILRLMRKGVTMLENIRLLKWAQELGMRVLWNLLAGLPSEPPEAYAEMERLIPLLTHLPPPSRFRYVSIVPHSPLFEGQAGDAVEVAPAYAFIFPFSGDAVANLATTFYLKPEAYATIDRYTAGVQSAVVDWRRLHATSELLLFMDRDSSLVVDSRPSAADRLVTLQGLEHLLNSACSEIRSLSWLRRLAEAEAPGPSSSAAVEGVLGGLIERGLMVRERNRFLSLAVRSHVGEERCGPSWRPA